MNSKYLSSPGNISRFVNMSARSLSPQQEISQMTPQLQRPQRKTNRDSNSGRGEKMEDDDLIHEVNHAEENIVENTAYLFQCGSPLYDPVKESWRCWNDHELRVKERSHYVDVEGVSCDFCGFTDWLEELREADATQLKQKRRGRKTKKQKKVQEESRYFYHCDVCGMDLCTYCAKELTSDSRYHVPCMQCRRCLLFMRDDEAGLHHCYVKRVREGVTLPMFSASTSGGASSSSVTDSVTTLPSARLRESSPLVVSLPDDSTATPPMFPVTTWEVCVAFENAAAEAEVRFIGDTLSLKGVEAPGVPGHLLFRTPTRLAAEEFAQLIHNKGLFASLRRFHA